MNGQAGPAHRLDFFLLIPATVALGPALPFGLAATTLTLLGSLVVGASGGCEALAAQMRSSREVAALWLMMMAAGLALTTMWVHVLRGRTWMRATRRRQTFTLAALASGFAATACWVSRLPIPPHDSGERKAVAFWTILLAGPVVVGMRQVWRLVRVATSERSTDSEPAATGTQGGAGAL